MAFEGLSEKLNAAFKKLRGKGRLTEADVREGMREVRLALLERTSAIGWSRILWHRSQSAVSVQMCWTA
mgnify:FL=1